MPVKRARRRFVEVDLQHVSLDRGGRSVLADVGWRVRPGERWVLLGANGAGKTQLLKILAGAVWPNPDGRHVLRWRHGGAWQRSPRDVLQDIAYLGPERQDRYERHGWNHRVREVVGTGVHGTDIPLRPLTARELAITERILRRLRLVALGSRRFLTLSYGERRRVLLARALASQPGLLLLDELLTGLDAVQRRAVMGWLESRRDASLPWVLSTHRLEDVPRSATHALVLSAGGVRYCGALERDHLREYFAPDAGRRTVLRRAGVRRTAAGSTARSWFRFSKASIFLDYRPVLRDVDWEVRAGECWIVRGGNGTGKTTLLRTIYGDHPVARGGSIIRRGIVPGVPLSEFRKHCGFVAPHLQTDYPRDALALDVVVSGLHASIGLNELATARERAQARRALLRCNALALAPRRLADLSYGEVRRVLFARALVRRPKLLLLDEAFAGLDVITRRELIALVDSLIGGNVAVVLATHLHEEVPALASHELRLCAGRAQRASLLPGRPIAAQ